MSKIKLNAKPTAAQRKAYTALVQRGREFMRSRQAFFTDPDCLPCMIMACIAEGARTRDDIIRNVPKFVGHSYAHVASTLDQFAGASIEEHFWYIDEAKAYHLLVPSKPLDPPVQLKIGSSRNSSARRRAILRSDAGEDRTF